MYRLIWSGCITGALAAIIIPPLVFHKGVWMILTGLPCSRPRNVYTPVNSVVNGGVTATHSTPINQP